MAYFTTRPESFANIGRVFFKIPYSFSWRSKNPPVCISKTDSISCREVLEEAIKDNKYHQYILSQGKENNKKTDFSNVADYEREVSRKRESY